MPELPEVETIRRGLAPMLEGARIEEVRLNRPDLRFPFPKDFAASLSGRTIISTGRRAKYLLFELDNGLVWLSHLGMTGNFRFSAAALSEPSRYRQPAGNGKHEHVQLALSHPSNGDMVLVYSDPRRFGFMTTYKDASQCPCLRGLGPEPLGNELTAPGLARRLFGRRGPIKTALLDQHLVAGLGNIYVCEALHRARISPLCPAGLLAGEDGLPRPELDALVRAIREVLTEALIAGGSTLRDFRNAQGESGYFQHRFAVYDREGEPCVRPGCGGRVERLVQSGRSTFHCPVCQDTGAASQGAESS
ncbi:MAG TPA: bifunctional DNA-formamidopyrimidine glycosylase/DNA-(apurinic or apyrimidinic site) lyase [Devosiaceae bacterium]